MIQGTLTYGSFPTRLDSSYTRLLFLVGPETRVLRESGVPEMLGAGNAAVIPTANCRERSRFGAPG